jgi:histidinol phosphatase-like enzyme
VTAVALLDRDGTINVKAPEGEYVSAPEQLELLPGAPAAVRALNDAADPRRRGDQPARHRARAG